MSHPLDFEKPIVEIENTIRELRQKMTSGSKKTNMEPEIKKLEQKLEKMKADIYKNLRPGRESRSPAIPNVPTPLIISA